jgi:hypothetical protein
MIMYFYNVHVLITGYIWLLLDMYLVSIQYPLSRIIHFWVPLLTIMPGSYRKVWLLTFIDSMMTKSLHGNIHVYKTYLCNNDVVCYYISGCFKSVLQEAKG